MFQFHGPMTAKSTWSSRSNSNNPPGFRVGEHVKVLYQHGRPEHAKIDSFIQLWLPELVLTIVGGGFSVIPAIIVRRRLKQRA